MARTRNAARTHLSPRWKPSLPGKTDHVRMAASLLTTPTVCDEPPDDCSLQLSTALDLIDSLMDTMQAKSVLEPSDLLSQLQTAREKKGKDSSWAAMLVPIHAIERFLEILHDTSQEIYKEKTEMDASNTSKLQLLETKFERNRVATSTIARGLATEVATFWTEANDPLASLVMSLEFGKVHQGQLKDLEIAQALLKTLKKAVITNEWVGLLR